MFLSFFLCVPKGEVKRGSWGHNTFINSRMENYFPFAHFLFIE